MSKQSNHINYLIKMNEHKIGWDNAVAKWKKDRNWKYKIGQDKVAVVLMAIMAAVFVALATWMYKTKNGAFFFGALIAIKWNLISVSSIGLTIATICLLFNSYFFFQVKIEKEGFYCRTNPFNGHYYVYEKIKKCHTIRKVVRHRRGERRYYFFFVFVDANGKKRKFQYSEDVYEQEIRVLKERIGCGATAQQ